MANFLAYKYEFERDAALSSGLSTSIQEQIDAEYIRKKWGEKIDPEICKEWEHPVTKKGELYLTHTNLEVLHHDISVGMTHDVKGVEIWKELVRDPLIEPSYPHGIVIFDNRKHAQQLLVQQGGAFSNADTATRRIEEYMNDFLRDYGYKVKLYSKHNATEAFDVVDENVNKGNGVEKLSFNIRNIDQMAGTQHDSELIKYLLLWNESIEGVTSSFTSKSKSKSTPLKISRTNEYCCRLFELLADNSYWLEIKFYDGQKYSSDNMSPAVIMIEDKIIDDYKVHKEQTAESTKLGQLLDTLRNPKIYNERAFSKDK